MGKTSNAKQRDRARVVLLAIDGLTTPEIALRTERDRRWIQRWCYAYRDRGLAGITPKKQTGRAPLLPRDRYDAFKRRVLAGPTEADGVCTLRGRDFQRILKQEFGKEMCLSAVYRLLHRLNLSCLKPRPQHRKSDPQAQAQWVERAPFLSKK